MTWLTSAVSVPLTVLLSGLASPLLANLDFFLVAIFCGALLSLALMSGLITLPGRRAGASQDFTVILVIFAAPVGLWLAIASTPGTADLPNALLYFLGLAVPAAAVLADQVATHHIYWATANPMTPAEVMITCREDWSRRFGSGGTATVDVSEQQAILRSLPGALREVRRQYLAGFGILLLGVVAASVVVLLVSGGQPAFQLGLELTVAIALVLLLFGLCRTANQPGAFGRSWYALLHFLHYSHDTSSPGWVFHSPCGPVMNRRCLAVAALLVFSPAVVRITDYFVWFVVGDFNASVLPPGIAESVSADTYTRFLPAIQAAITGELYLGVCLVAVVAACVIVPGVILFLSLFLVAGPAIAAYRDTFDL